MQNKHKNDKRGPETRVFNTKNIKKEMKSRQLLNPVQIKDIYINKYISINNIIIFYYII